MFPYCESSRIFVIPRHSEIFPLEVSRSGKSHSSVRTGFVCEVGRTEGFGVKKNGLCYTVKREASMYLEHVASDLFDYGTVEKNMGIFFHIEKIGASEMVVSGFNAGENACRVHLDLHICTGYIRWVKVYETGDFIELTVNIVYHHVAYREMSHCMIRIDIPFCHVETPPYLLRHATFDLLYKETVCFRKYHAWILAWYVISSIRRL